MTTKIFARQLCLLFCLNALLIPATTLGHGDEEHGNHDASYGGLVMMYVDLHFEVVLPEAGGVQVYLSNASRAELPAAAVSDMTVEILRAGAAPEVVGMAISDAGDHWMGAGSPVLDPETIVRVAFVFQNEPVVFELPARLFPNFMEDKMDAMSAHHA